MEKAYGYTQMRINYIKSHAMTIFEQTVQLENTWHNRNNFNADNEDLERYFENQRKQIEENIKYLNSYLKPRED